MGKLQEVYDIQRKRVDDLIDIEKKLLLYNANLHCDVDTLKDIAVAIDENDYRLRVDKKH